MKCILIYRLGSLGDTVVALPALRLIERSFPNWKRWVLTNFSVSRKAAPIAEVLEGTDLVHGYIEYPLGVRDATSLLRVRKEIRKLKPEVLVYLAEPRGRLKIMRDAAFFYSCGIRHFVGITRSGVLQKPLKLMDGFYEYEGKRLLRSLHSLGQGDLDAPAAFDLCLNTQEREVAENTLITLKRNRPMIVVSIGAKVDVKNWGKANWVTLLERMGNSFPDAGLVAIGAEAEREASALLLEYWKGTSLNLCGKLSVRESAAVLDKADLFIGHDSGPMHLAAAVGTSCVAIFSSRNLPGHWFPYGEKHRVLYQPMACQGCKLDECFAYDKKCIKSISVDQVEAEVHSVLGAIGNTPKGK